MFNSTNLKKALEDRQKEFDRLKQHGGRTIDGLVDACAELTNEAGDRLGELADAAGGYFTSVGAERDEVLAATSAELETIAGSDDASAYTSIKLATLEVRLSTLKHLEAEDAKKLAGIRDFSAALVTEILEKDASSFTMDAFIKSLDVAIGAVPVAGNVYSALKAAYELLNHDRTRAKGAADVVNALDDYCYALAAWIAAADQMIAKFRTDSSDD